jgi:YVTN family beta-propeller protein
VNELWVTDPVSGKVHSFVLTGNSWIENGNIATGLAPFALTFSPDGNKCYVTNHGNGKVSVINANTKSKISDISVGIGPAVILTKN